MNDLLSLFNDANARHAMIVHWPIVLCGVLPVMALLVLAFGHKSRTLAALTLACCLGASAGAYAAVQSGEDAEHALPMKSGALSVAEGKAVHEHEELAENGWVWPLIPGVFAALSLVRFRSVAPRFAAGGLLLLTSLGVVGWVATTAHAGGRLVYEFGLGVPERGKAEAVSGASASTGNAGEASKDAGKPEKHEGADAD
ncbi:MAG: hypothetical protein J0L61_09000 [Planctomycetes bacterium]|nr:hypothetical protein [Planctomycetota bacterium]